MNQLTRPYSLLLCLVFSAGLSAQNTCQCTVLDKQKKTWTATSQYHRTATNKALESCKKESQDPMSCKKMSETCTQPIKSNAEEKKWQCATMDQRGTAFHGQGMTEEKAALDSKTTCKKASPIPDTCYVSMLTCKQTA